ncbi:toxin YoeB [Capnocytophaga haemolytica]|jgi:addiction module toxin, txe/yoeB family|uniref:Putative mRNA interferase YoeB n=1 Tax=Capnocytophaga haemolytica TaxID=45243 RepID=A0AAX2GYA4_9FLAO|nr:Txe/YoeB family addiction module toxin [Capnocytophaga haemolytica]AMD84389.1 addiction module toxin YoeB [Capnocytophaga haemolytica]SFO10857.1 toxin YoeB [Capnocytophaga haemolytica]SNV10855.1 Toxin RelK [Capnocytophaga haemolytica]
MENNENKYALDFSDKYFDHIKEHSKSGQKKLIDKIEILLSEIEIAPKQGTGHPEPLLGYGVRDVWSRRIDGKHRLTYEILEDKKEVFIMAAYGHYNDK